VNPIDTGSFIGAKLNPNITIIREPSRIFIKEDR
jgi:hypothetical protein